MSKMEQIVIDVGKNAVNHERMQTKKSPNNTQLHVHGLPAELVIALRTYLRENGRTQRFFVAEALKAALTKALKEKQCTSTS